MALQRTNPLPVGRYWIDIFGEEKNLEFRSWLARNSASLTVEKDEYHIATDGYPMHTWYRFAVTAPVAWEGPGFPDIIPEGESGPNTTSETAQTPHVPSTGEEIDALEQSVKDAASGASEAIKNGVMIALIIAGGYLAYRALS